MFESLHQEGIIPPTWEQKDLEAYLTDRTRKKPEGGKYRGVNFNAPLDIDVPGTYQEYAKRVSDDVGTPGGSIDFMADQGSMFNRPKLSDDTAMIALSDARKRLKMIQSTKLSGGVMGKQFAGELGNRERQTLGEIRELEKQLRGEAPKGQGGLFADAMPDRTPEDMTDLIYRRQLSPEKFKDMVPATLLKKLDPQGRHEILKDLSEILNVPFRVGRLGGKKVLGFYRARPESIRTKIADDIERTIPHEVGHHVNKLLYGTGKGDSLNTKPLKPFKDELYPLGKPTSPGKDPAKNKLLKEGFANFVRFYLTAPVTAKELAPNFYEFFESEIKGQQDLYDVLQEFRAKVKLYVEMPALAKIESMISRDAEQIAVSNRWQQFYTGIVDRLKPMNDAVEIIKQHGADVTSDKNAYILNRLVAGWAGKANHFLQYGTISYKELGKVGPSLKSILKPVEGDLKNFETFLVIARSTEKGAQGVDVGIEVEDIKKGLVQLQELVGPQQMDKFVKAGKGLYKFQNELKQYLVDSEVLGSELDALISSKNLLYVPFYRLMEANQPMSGGGKGMADLWNPIKKMKGSHRPIISPLESIIKNVYTFVDLAERNGVALALVKQARRAEGVDFLVEDVSKNMIPTTFTMAELKKQMAELGFPLVKLTAGPKTEKLVSGDLKTTKLTNVDAETLTAKQMEAFLTIFRPEQFVPKGKNIIAVFEDGKRKFYQLHPDLYKTLQGLDRESSNMFIKILSKPAKLLRIGATSLSPEFIAIRNPWRDMQTAFLQAGASPINSIRGLFHVLKRDELFQEWQRSGGPHAALVSMDRTSLQQNVKDMLASNKEWAFMHPIDAMRVFGEMMEAMTRVGIYEKVRKEGGTIREAGFESREGTLDFAKMGSWVQQVNQITAFFAASINGTDKFFRMHKENPKKAIQRGALFATAALMHYMWIRDDEEYWEQPQWLRDFFLLIPTKGTPLYKLTPFIPMPKPFLWGSMYMTIPQRAMKWIDQNENDPTGQNPFNGLLAEMAQHTIPPIFPSGVKGIIEVLSGFNFFGWRPVKPGYVNKNLDPTFQVTPYSSTWSKETAKALRYIGVHISPIDLDHVVFGLTAGMGKGISTVIDSIFDRNRPTQQMADVPFVKAFAVRQHSASTSSTEQFYKLLNELKRKEVSAKFAKDNNITLKPGQKLTGREAFTLKKLKKVSREMNTIAREIRKIDESKSLNPQEKRRRIDELNIKRVLKARQAIQIKKAA